MPKFRQQLRRGTRAQQAAWTPPPIVGAVYVVTDEDLVEQWTGSAWMAIDDEPVRWEDTQVNAYALRDVGANIPTITQVGTSGVYLPLFDLNDQLVFTIQMPHGRKEASDIEPHIHWFGSTTDATNVVKWALEYEWVNVNGTWSAAPGTVIYAEGLATAYRHVIAGFPTIEDTTHTLSSIIAGRITRITNGGTDYAGNVFFHYFDLHIQMDARGSTSEYVK